jgi:ABC-type bacteriocin/lantibiotic exporter with double-glycine peptidase domain
MQTEEKIIANLRKNYPNCLLIIISHRLAHLQPDRRIVLLHGDRQRNTHSPATDGGF